MQMLYVKLANFTGIPAISVPSGYDNDGLPTGIMLHGKWYDEEKLIKTSFHFEKLFERQKPQVFYNYWTPQIHINTYLCWNHKIYHLSMAFLSKLII